MVVIEPGWPLNHLVDIGPGRVVAQLLQQHAVGAHAQARLQQRLGIDRSTRQPILAVEEAHLIGLQHRELERVFDRDQPLAGVDRSEHRFREGRLAGAGAAGQQHVQPRPHRGGEKALQVAGIIEGQEFRQVPARAQIAPAVPVLAR